MKRLVIVESPNKIKSLEKYLGGDYIVKASVGHIVKLPSSGENGFGVDMETWTPKYKIDPDKKKVVDELKTAVKEVEEVLIATDPDREGEAIGENLVQFLKIKDKYKRIRFNEITKNAVLQAVDSPTEIDYKLVESQIARRILDRIIGYQLSGLMRKKIHNAGGTTSAGRVQSIALKIIVEREREIEAFVPVRYDKIEAVINPEIRAILNNGNYHDHKEWINPEETKDILKTLGSNELEVVKAKKSKRKDNKLTPFKQATLYKRADSKLGLSSSVTQRAAQRLYEGYGDGGLITYPRTDSTRMSNTFVTTAKEYIKKNFGDEYVAQNIKGSGGAQDAHEAIRITNIDLNPEMAKAQFKLSSSEYKVYKMVYEHTIQSLMEVPIREITRFDLAYQDHEFKLSASKVIFDGYLKLTGYEKSLELPNYSEGEKIAIKEYVAEEKETKPPARYNDGSLIEKMDSIGVGRPSTFAETVNKLKARVYVELEGKAMKATILGKAVLDKLIEIFPEIINEKYTSEMETKLDEIADGKYEYQKLLGDFWGVFEKEVQTATQEISVTKLQNIPAPDGKDCPNCGKHLIVRTNRRDKTRFFACPGFPECKYTESDPTSKKKFFPKKKWVKKK